MFLKIISVIYKTGKKPGFIPSKKNEPIPSFTLDDDKILVHIDEDENEEGKINVFCFSEKEIDKEGEEEFSDPGLSPIIGNGNEDSFIDGEYSDDELDLNSESTFNLSDMKFVEEIPKVKLNKPEDLDSLSKGALNKIVSQINKKSGIYSELSHYIHFNVKIQKYSEKYPTATLIMRLIYFYKYMELFSKEYKAEAIKKIVDVNSAAYIVANFNWLKLKMVLEKMIENGKVDLGKLRIKVVGKMLDNFSAILLKYSKAKENYNDPNSVKKTKFGSDKKVDLEKIKEEWKAKLLESKEDCIKSLSLLVGYFKDFL